MQVAEDQAGGRRVVQQGLHGIALCLPCADRVVGDARAAGSCAIRYRLTVDLARADAALPQGVMVPTGPYRALSQIPAEVWLDADGLARRIAVVAGPGAGDDRPIWSVVEFWDFGVAAGITPPGPGELVPPRDAYRERPGTSSP